jgi:hypothetical protein
LRHCRNLAGPENKSSNKKEATGKWSVASFLLLEMQEGESAAVFSWQQGLMER